MSKEAEVPAVGEGPVAARRVAGVVLAAGRSTRMGRPKALLDADGTTFVNRLAATLADGGCEPVMVVVSCPDGAVAREVAMGPGHAVVNPGGAGGQIGSLRVALSRLRKLPEPPLAVAFTPVDNPVVAPATVRRLVHAWLRTGAAITLPRFGDERGHPVLVAMEIAGEFFDAELPEGARGVVRRDPDRVLEVAVADPGAVDDLDTPGRYRERFLEGEAAGQGGRRGAPDGRSATP